MAAGGGAGGRDLLLVGTGIALGVGACAAVRQLWGGGSAPEQQQQQQQQPAAAHRPPTVLPPFAQALHEEAAAASSGSADGDDGGLREVRMREWDDTEWRRSSGWKGRDLIHNPEGGGVRVLSYHWRPATKELVGVVWFGPDAESHRGLCHGGAMT